jgi:hypothetical protein
VRLLYRCVLGWYDRSKIRLGQLFQYITFSLAKTGIFLIGYSRCITGFIDLADIATGHLLIA